MPNKALGGRVEIRRAVPQHAEIRPAGRHIPKVERPKMKHVRRTPPDWKELAGYSVGAP